MDSRSRQLELAVLFCFGLSLSGAPRALAVVVSFFVPFIAINHYKHNI